ncbi:MAG: tripartite tricarboxylate transporter substrate binding protein [Deltaproteobacteria bacterium]|nr:tripartite tricarboxylate transporter substrate binding protein [Deltaproteobacteria bacterium]
MKTVSKSFRLSIIAAAVAFILCITGMWAIAAEKFPSKTIDVIIHAKYGGGTDTTARMMMIRARRILGVDMQVIAKRGGAGAKAHQFALQRPRDGYTMLALTQTHLYTIARGKSPITIDDMVGVARAMNDATFITVNAKSDFKTIEDLIAASRKKPLNWGVAQIGGTEHIGLAQFCNAVGIKHKAVPFGSGAQMIQALMSAAIDATLPNVSEARSQIADGVLRPLIVMSEKRLAAYPDVPTTYEKGWKIDCSTTRGYWVLKGTPMDRVKILSDALVKAMSHEVFANYLKSAGLTVEESVAGHEVWDAHIKREYAKAVEAVTKLGFK